MRLRWALLLVLLIGTGAAIAQISAEHNFGKPGSTMTVSLRLIEDEDPQLPTIVTPPTATITLQGQAEPLTVQLAGGTYSESCREKIVVFYGSSYEDYGNPDAFWQYKTASVGRYEDEAASPLINPSVEIGPRCYNSDSLNVYVVAIDGDGNETAPTQIHYDKIQMPIGPVPDINHDEWGVGAMELTEDNYDIWSWAAQTNGAENWGDTDIAILNYGQLLGGPMTDTDDYPPGWLRDARAAGGRNQIAVEHLQIKVVNEPLVPAYQRLYQYMYNLYAAGDDSIFAHDFEDSLVYSTAGATDIEVDGVDVYTGVHDAHVVNLTYEDSREAYAYALIAEWNHSDNWTSHTGFMFDVWENTSGPGVWSITEGGDRLIHGPGGTSWGGDWYDWDNDGTPLGDDIDDQRSMARLYSQLLLDIRAEAKRTNTEEIGAQRLILGANTDSAFMDTLMSKQLDFVSIEGFDTGDEDAGDPESECGMTIWWEHPFHNAADPTWRKGFLTASPNYTLQLQAGDVPDPDYAVVGMDLAHMADRFRTFSGGPWIVPEPCRRITTQGMEGLEVYALLWDNVYSQYLYPSNGNPAANTKWWRMWHHPWANGYYDSTVLIPDGIENLGGATGAATLDSTSIADTWTWTREYDNGTAYFQIADRDAWTNGDTDLWEYKLVVDGVTIRDSGNFQEPAATFTIDSVGLRDNLTLDGVQLMDLSVNEGGTWWWRVRYQVAQTDVALACDSVGWSSWSSWASRSTSLTGFDPGGSSAPTETGLWYTAVQVQVSDADGGPATDTACASFQSPK